MSSSEDSEDDVDYIPEEDIASEESDSGENEDDIEYKKTALKKTQQNIEVLQRKRSGGIRLGDEGSELDEEDSSTLQQTQEEENNIRHVVKEKQKADALWASFMSDVGGVKRKQESKPKSVPKETTKSDDMTGVTNKSMVKVTQVFDFAGEEVKVTKEVAADSKEAKQQVQHEQAGQAAGTGAASAASGAAAADSGPLSRPLPAARGGLLATAPSIKRKAGGGLSSVLDKIGKKPKISVLDKSKLDWDHYKTETGISDELATHNRGKKGYIERQQFLQRADLRQFEIEKSLRQSNSKR